MNVIVDADACPVKDIIIEETEKKSISVILVSSIDHYSMTIEPSHVKHIYVEKGNDAADFKIVALVKPGDIVVTQDYGLASLLLPKKVIVIHHKGFLYTDENIQGLLQTRHFSALARNSGQRTKGPKPLTKEDKKKFRQLFLSKLVTP
ncbi:YaiI/YqxD family protein [Lacticigenium naphthae]|uniref:YaiI/YqxD family protein n=1 Tax=Lacticigenium naphthae TaxID=515351 RepID=UPI0003F8CEEF|nr:YaiI/YqxD family protein [Lacticigenium naphthae]